MAIYGVRRKKVKDIRAQETRELLQRRKKDEERRHKVEVAESKRRLVEAERDYYQAKAEKKEAKRKSSFQWSPFAVPRVKVRKKKQGRKLSSRSRIKLI